MMTEEATSQTPGSSSAVIYGQGSVNGFNGRKPEIVVSSPPDLEVRVGLVPCSCQGKHCCCCHYVTACSVAQESVDELRAEIASTRSTLQLLKSRSNGSQPVARRL